MIHWLLESFAAHPDLARGIAPVGLLSASEEARLAGFKFEKKRREWLLGRWTAKRLIQSVIFAERGERIDSRALTIANDANGVPFATLKNLAGPASLTSFHQAGLPGFTLSISHRGDYAFSAVVTDGRKVGADIEHVEPLSDNFISDYMTPAEQRLIERAPAMARDRVSLTIWSAKESALKALGLGLSVDTRAVICLVGLAPHLPSPSGVRDSRSGAEGRGAGGEVLWQRFKVCCNIEMLPAAPPLYGWWRAFNDYVLTLVVEARPGDGVLEPDTDPIAETPN